MYDLLLFYLGTLWLFSALSFCRENPQPNSNKAPYAVSNWIALGDSFSAGPGAGKEYNDGKDGRPPGGSGHCMRRTESYPPLLQGDEQMPGPNGPQSGKPEFKFVSCTGDTTVEMLDMTIGDNQIRQIPRGTKLGTLSIGGNDVLFGPILKACIMGVALMCETKKKEGLDVLYSGDFHNRYNQVLTKTVQDKFQWTSGTSAHTSLYVTSYIQFFDDWTDQCDQATFSPSPFADKVTKKLRKEMNNMVHQLNEVLQYKIDLRNVGAWTGRGWQTNGPEWFYTAIHFVDMDWRYLDHRFCREGIHEPDEHHDTWFFHLKILGSNEDPIEVDMSQKDNETYIDELIPMTWTPGKNGDAPFDENDPIQVENKETQTRTFHPKPDGFRAETKALVDMLYQDELQTGLAGKGMFLMCVGDITSLGEHVGFDAETRYGYLPYLDHILNRWANFGGQLRHRFIGRNHGYYGGDYDSEIYPFVESLGHLAGRMRTNPLLTHPIYQGRIVIPMMVGAKDLLMGRKVDDMLPEMHWMLQEIWSKDKNAVVLLATIPMIGEQNDRGDEFWPLQRAVIEWNSRLAALVSYYARKEKRPIVKVHISTTQKEHIKQNLYIPNKEGYQRMAYDWLAGLVQANERGFFDGDRWTMQTLEDLQNTKEEELNATDPICTQSREQEQKVEDVKRSLFRGAKDQTDWVENYACNPDMQCRYCMDLEMPNMQTQYPWSNGTTCVSTGGIEPWKPTLHQLLIRRDGAQDDMGDWCVENVNNILNKCVDEGSFNGGYWSDGKRLINLTNIGWKETMKLSPTTEVESWYNIFGKYEDSVAAMKNGPVLPEDFVPMSPNTGKSQGDQ
ncbi:hypothetical protein K458DRAFT_434464 [Lentithecium fluviatile CBS 122367]|uniref:SGNH hydrolase n=1 Tax=Lentithecium fluviatile CBS 122367 TaxID=1168545 RepID=A0A6G1IQD6_9PLEO|nr:hypothetical protein K458DRAFT_434464 [Lentithecium fluviatile CBS 122367]